jgi:hypothetical protein
MKKVFGIALGSAVVILIVAGAVSLVFAQAAGAKYVGVDKCKNCHSSDKKGNQYAKWKTEDHAKAYEKLAEPAAKEAGKKLGVDDPQKSDKCLKCHTTAAGVPKDQLEASFKPEEVQCEACHGPGGNHVKARLAASAEGGDALGEKGAEGPAKLGAGEILIPTADTCTKCHQKESPTFKSFNFDEMKKKIAHPDPRKAK